MSSQAAFPLQNALAQNQNNYYCSAFVYPPRKLLFKRILYQCSSTASWCSDSRVRAPWACWHFFLDRLPNKWQQTLFESHAMTEK
ncbi:hypothetical protein EDS67_22365 [candidate division KSB1 bacterium]|nr:MAG: hypothetical protein EDS67_22365 [candidate division KSB1 bacterium]MBC6947442.1 hypothetical protein [candidate division KSB1 bacterium]MCE7943726.1 hypothetical protein [Chlorobi bacterium CHB1]